jgi:hypothetical protein
MARHEKRSFGEVLLAGGDIHEGVRVLLRNADMHVLLGTCTTVPSTVAGFAKSCLLIKTDAAGGAKGLYENTGTTTSCVFDVIGDIAAAEITLAQGSVLIGNASGLATALSGAGDKTVLIGNGTTMTAHAIAGDVNVGNDGASVIQAGAVDYAMIQNTAAGFKVIGKKDTGAGSVEEIALAADQVLAKSGTGNIAGQKVVPAMTSDIPVGLNYGVPDALVDDRFVADVAMKVGAYTVAHASPADGLCHNIMVTVTKNGGIDTMGTITIDGTAYDDSVIQEVIVPAEGAVSGTKAFKTVTAVTGAGWVTDGTDDHVKVGFGGLIGLPLVLAAAADLVMATHGTGVLNAPTVAVGATVEDCTIDISTAGDGSKRLRLFYQN